MPSSFESKPKTLQQLVEDVGLYPPEAYDFVQEGLSYTVAKLHGKETDPKVNRHVSGQQLCEGLRDFAAARWGRMALAVLERWSITSTYDFGKIVFALIEINQMQKTDDDTIEDFRNVFDFKTAFESGYRIPFQAPAPCPSTPRS